MKRLSIIAFLLFLAYVTANSNGNGKDKYKKGFDCKYYILASSSVVHEAKLKGYCNPIFVVYKENGGIKLTTLNKLEAFDELKKIANIL